MSRSLKQLADGLRRSREKWLDEAEKAAKDEATAAQQRMEAHFVQYPGGLRPWESRPAGKLFIRSGGLAGSVRAVVRRVGDVIELALSMTGVQAWLQERGGIVRRKTAPNLTIPVGEQLDGRGVRTHATVAASRSEWALRRVVSALRGRRHGEPAGSRERVQWLLRQAVRIPGRAVVHPEVEAAVENLRSELKAATVEALS